ncbi:MAG: hypothetical protein K1X79_01115 [Oligoflexia bacterium]|nr:hypothetical protein [Oligoflexia bacterium]
MSEINLTLINNLLALSKLDGSLAHIVSERKRWDSEVKARVQERNKAQASYQAKLKQFEDRRSLCKQEEKNLGEERQRLTERRKALKTLGTYKLQQAAEREIEHINRELNSREEGLIKMISEAEVLEKEVAALSDALQKAQTTLSQLEEKAKTDLSDLETREREYKAERESLVPQLDAASITTYNKVRDKHPGSAIAMVSNNSCTGCFMQIGPQLVVQVAKGLALQRCPGCGRILYLSPDAAKPK